MKISQPIAGLCLTALLSACGGGGGGESTTLVTPTPVPADTSFKVVDFVQGHFSIVGETVLKPPFSNNRSTYCYIKGNNAAVDTALAALDLNCQNGMYGGTGGSVQDFPIQSWSNSPARFTSTATAAKSLDVDITGVGSLISDLKRGESYGSGITYSWSNFPGITGATKFDFSYKNSSSAGQTGLLTTTTNKVDIGVTLYTTNSFGQDIGVYYPVMSKQYDGDFSDSSTVTFDPKTYDPNSTARTVQLTVKIRHLIKFTRTN